MRAGVIGGADRLVPRLQAAGIEPLVHSPDGPAPGGAATVREYPEFFEALEHPRAFLFDLDPGAEVDRLIDAAYVVMEPGDVVVDLSGSYWGDTLRRYRRMRHRSLFYVDAALVEDRGSATLLAAGDPRGLDIVTPLLARLAGGEDRLVRAGGSGAAHYALMVHDAWRTALTHAASEVHQAL